MPIDRSFLERNRAATERIRGMGRLSEAELLARVGEHWTAAVALAHLAFWDRRVSFILEKTARDSRLYLAEVDVLVNDLSLPLWLAIPPRAAARLALEAAEALDHQLEEYPPAWLERIYVHNPRWIERHLHRNAHLDEIAAALGKKI